MKTNIKLKCNKYKFLNSQYFYDPNRRLKVKKLIDNENPRGIIKAPTIELAVDLFKQIYYPSLECSRSFNSYPFKSKKVKNIPDIFQEAQMEAYNLAAFSFYTKTFTKRFFVVEL